MASSFCTQYLCTNNHFVGRWNREACKYKQLSVITDGGKAKIQYGGFWAELEFHTVSYCETNNVEKHLNIGLMNFFL